MPYKRMLHMAVAHSEDGQSVGIALYAFAYNLSFLYMITLVRVKCRPARCPLLKHLGSYISSRQSYHVPTYQLFLLSQPLRFDMYCGYQLREYSCIISSIYSSMYSLYSAKSVCRVFIKNPMYPQTCRQRHYAIFLSMITQLKLQESLKYNL